MRCPRTSFRCCAVFSAGSNPDFDLCATVRDFHPCFPRPTDWLKCERELFEKFRSFQERSSLADWRSYRNVSSYSDMSICRVNSKKAHSRTFLVGTAPSRAWTPQRSPRNLPAYSIKRTKHPCRFASQTPPMHSSGKKMPTRNRSFGQFVGTFFQLLSFFPQEKTWHGVCSILLAVKRPMDWVTTNKSL